MKEIKSTITGVLSEILVKVGEPIKVGDEVAIIESMKMEIPLEAGEEGRVVEIRAKVDESVMEGDVLMLLE